MFIASIQYLWYNQRQCNEATHHYEDGEQGEQDERGQEDEQGHDRGDLSYLPDHMHRAHRLHNPT